MGSRRFLTGFAVRLVALFLSIGAAAAGYGLEGPGMVLIFFSLLAIVLAVEFIRHIGRTDRELARFVDALAHRDFTQAFSGSLQKTGFNELGAALDRAMAQLRATRAREEVELRHLRAVIEQVPVPLMSVLPRGRVTLLNRAARRFFSPVGIIRLTDLAPFGPELIEALRTMQPGERRMIRLDDTGEGPRRLAISLAELIVAGETRRLIALQNISSELEATELAAWQELVRVLTHEIMNSLTPVSSLAATAAALLGEDNAPDKAKMIDIRAAVATVARRAGALMSFVESYRQLARMPAPHIRRVTAAELFERISTIHHAAGTNALAMPPIKMEIRPPSLEFLADPEQIEQALINLLRNAAEALEGQDDGYIRLSATLDRRGRAVISVADNGPGVPEDLRDRVFVPFFTTRRGGSGVGLALVRQIMTTHGGAISLARSDDGGALFRLVFR